MKNLFIILSLFLISCEKELPPIEEPIPPVEVISVFGDWLLVDGKMYMENLETHKKTVYEHFDDTKNVSSLRYDGPMFEFERIVVDSTV